MSRSYLSPGTRKLLFAFLCLGWLIHFCAEIWFVAHGEVVEAKAIERPSKRKFAWPALEVAYLEADGKVMLDRVEWRVTRKPQNDQETILLRKSESGPIGLRPASLAEAFWLEVMMAYVGLIVGSLFLVVRFATRSKPSP